MTRGNSTLQIPARTLWPQVVPLIRRLACTLTRWLQLSEQRRQLRDMDDRMLKDIGLSQADVHRIAGQRRFWDDPGESGEKIDERYRTSDSVGSTTVRY